MTIKKIIAGSFGVLLLAAVLLSYSIYTVHQSAAAMRKAEMDEKRSLLLADELRESSRKLTESVRAFAVTGDERFAGIYMDVVNIRAGKMSRPMDRTIAPGETTPLDELLKQAGFSDTELSLLEQAKNFSNDLIILETKAMNAVRGLFPDAQGNYSIEGTPDKALAASLVFSQAYDGEVSKIMAPFSKFEKELKSRLDAAVRDAQDSYANSMLLLQACIIVLVVMFIGFLLLVQRCIVRPVLLCDRFAGEVAKGRLESSLAYESRNEIGSLAASLRTMLQSLRERISMAETATAKAEEQSMRAAEAVKEAEAAKHAAEQAKSLGMRQAGEQFMDIVEATKRTVMELSKQINQAGKGAESQQQRLTESSQAMEQMNQAIMEVARSTSDTTESANATQQNAMEGAVVVAKVVEAISAVDSRTAALQLSLDQLGQQAEGIGRIMAVISDIADQTNLLALNAAIEAARAGEAGRGFAVVADEVRKLAEKTMHATSEVGAAVRAIQDGTAENIRYMQGASDAVKTSTDLATSAGESLQLIVDIAKGTAQQIQSIAVAAEQQSSTCEGLAHTTESINIVASETLSIMGEADMALGVMEEDVRRLSELIEELRRA